MAHRAPVRETLRLAVLLLLMVGCETKDRLTEPPAAAPASSEAAVLVGAGDIAVCGFGNAERTATLLDKVPGTVFTLGDNAYPDGTLEEFTACYGPSWGRHRSRTRPSPGNHDYNTPGAAGYFAYFGEQAGPPGRGYYSYTSGSWRVFSLNSNVPAGRSSAQYQWLRGELAANNSACVVAYWHHPVFSSGFEGDLPQMRDIWALLYEHGAEIVLAGHGHHYERFTPMDAAGHADAARGIRQFIVGTGGSAYTQLVNRRSTSEVFENATLGVLKLTLRSTEYAWEFIAPPGYAFSDAGTGRCL